VSEAQWLLGLVQDDTRSLSKVNGYTQRPWITDLYRYPSTDYSNDQYCGCFGTDLPHNRGYRTVLAINPTTPM
jgi:hypothetical protein